MFQPCEELFPYLQGQHYFHTLFCYFRTNGVEITKIGVNFHTHLQSLEKVTNVWPPDNATMSLLDRPMR
jgi:hypothetical protein